MSTSPVWPLLIGAAAIPVGWLLGRLKPALSTVVFAVASTAAFATTGLLWLDGPLAVAWPWAPTWNLEFALRLDGLAALFGLLITGTGATVGLYAIGYLPDYLDDHDHPRHRQVPFSLWMIAFMTSMVGLVLADDLLVLFVFWELTTVTSYFLIAFDATESANDSARMALLITGVSAVLLLVAILVLRVELGVFSIEAARASGLSEPTATVVAALVALAALAKSAQVPLHVWLPRAMVAPTPVSAYLHSAAMVAAGVFVIARLYPLLTHSSPVASLLPWIGVVSMLAGSLLALASDKLKQLLAYSTIAQYGYVVVLLGLGGRYGRIGAGFYVLVHGLAKAALFMVAGGVTEATGRKRLSEIGGLLGDLPRLATTCGIAAASLAALPPTMGFFKDELLFEAALETGGLFVVSVVVGAGLTLAYIGKFFAGIFLGDPTGEADDVPASLWVAPALLTTVLVIGGIWPTPFAHLAEHAAAAMGPAVPSAHLAYELALPPPYIAALCAWTLGGLVWFGTQRRPDLVGRVTDPPAFLAPQRWYHSTISALAASSAWIGDLEERGLRIRLAVVMGALVLLVSAGLIRVDIYGFEFGRLRPEDIPLILGLTLAVLTSLALVMTATRNHLQLALGLTVVGFSLAAVFLLLQGPDVALVAVLVEMILTLVMLGLFALFPRPARETDLIPSTRSPSPWHQSAIAIAAGIVATLVVWHALSQTFPADSSSAAQWTLLADHPEVDPVAAVLSDFRALDTLGEITVLFIAMLGVSNLIHRRGGTS